MSTVRSRFFCVFGSSARRRIAVGAHMGMLLAATSMAPAAVPPEAPLRREVEAAVTPAPQAPLRPLRIVLLADRKDHGEHAHDYPLWQERWALLLGGKAASRETQANLYGPPIEDDRLSGGAQQVTVERAWNWPTEAQFATANAIVAFSYLPWTDARKQQVRQFLDRGAGWVTIHAATWTKPKADPAIADLIGVGGFTKFRHGLLNVDIVAPQHPICRGLPQRLIFQDEPYWPPTPDIDPHRVNVLAVSMEKTHEDRLAPQPLFWTYDSGRGRAFGCVPGHFTWTFDDPWFRLLLLRGIAWAAGESPGRLDALALRGARVRE